MFGQLIGIAMLAVAISSNALAQQSFQALESMNQFERALVVVDQIKNREKLQCVLATANGALCGCLSQNLPIDIYFRSYAAITSRESENFRVTGRSAPLTSITKYRDQQIG
jgi:hypothetical protein